MDQRFIIFAREDSKATRQLQLSMAEVVRSGDMCWCGTLNSFFGEFRKAHNYTAVLLLIKKKSDLAKIIDGMECFEGLRVFLILPDSNEKTIAMSHLLFPRFVTYIDNGYADLLKVIKKMARNHIQ